jgi:hypothetical protein
VKQQVADVVALLQDQPDRVKAELSRLGVRFTLYPVYDIPKGQRPYLRAVGEGDFEALVDTSPLFPTTGRSLQQARRGSSDDLFPVPLSPASGRELRTKNSSVFDDSAFNAPRGEGSA